MNSQSTLVSTPKRSTFYGRSFQTNLFRTIMNDTTMSSSYEEARFAPPRLLRRSPSLGVFPSSRTVTISCCSNVPKEAIESSSSLQLRYWWQTSMTLSQRSLLEEEINYQEERHMALPNSKISGKILSLSEMISRMTV